MIEFAKSVFLAEMKGIEEIGKTIDENFNMAIDLIAKCSGKVIVMGVGKSGIVGKKISATLSSTGTPSHFLHPTEALHGDSGCIQSSDIVIAISNSGETVELIHALSIVQKLNVKIIALTGIKESTLSKLSSVTLNTFVSSEACPIGMAPTTSTTGILVLGDALALCLMKKNNFDKEKFKFFHPGGSLGKK